MYFHEALKREKKEKFGDRGREGNRERKEIGANA